MSVEPIFKKFLCFFQSEGPLIHLLRGAMCELVKSLMGWFIKSQIFKDKARELAGIAVMLPTVSDEEAALITDEWKVLQSGDDVVDTN